MLSISLTYASSGTVSELSPDLTYTWVGLLSLVIFVVAYYFVATEEKYHIDKAKPALFAGTLPKATKQVWRLPHFL